MQCNFLDYTGGLFGGYYCKKDDKHIDRYTVNTYCDNSLRYRDCPIYNKSNSTCYLTTTMCVILGYEDDCTTLNTLRDFRDNYMKKTPECLPLLEDYDIVGPMVCEKLMNDKNKYRTAHIMLIEYLNPAIACINNGYYDDAIEIYKDMTLGLMKHYGLDTNELACAKEISIQKQRKIEPQMV